MTRRQLTFLLALGLLVSLSLGCFKFGPKPTATPEPTSTPTATWTPAPTNTPVPTNTSVPTNTPAPTHTPAPANTPEPASTTSPEKVDLPADAAKELLILVHNGFTDSSDGVHVVGEVYNNTNANYELVEVTCQFFDKNDKQVAEEFTYAYVDILVPGKKAPFKISLWEPPAGITRYVVSVSGEETDAEPFAGLEFVHDDGKIEEDTVTIFGEVTNKSETPASQVRISAAIYNEDGEIVDVAMTYTERDVFFEDSISPFMVYLSDLQGEPDNYALVVYATEAEDYEIDVLADLNLLGINYHEDGDNLIIVGEVLNEDTENATFVEAFASFYDADDELVMVEWSYIWANVLVPEAKSPFSIELYGAPKEIDHWTVWVEGDKAEEQVAGNLVLEETDNNVSDSNLVTFTGIIRNDGEETMTGIQVAATVYDGDGNVVTVGGTWMEGELAPDATLPFEFEVQADESADKFELYVQGTVQTD